MKYLFACILLALIAASVLTKTTEPDLRTDVPVLYWISDPNPLRAEQIRLFHEWLVASGHTTPDGKPCIELRLDSSNRGANKQLIQGVSGVAGDIMDCDIVEFQGYGLLADVTDAARKYGYDMSHTHRALAPLLTVDGRQYGFPCNVWVMNYWVNVDTFKRYGMDPPPGEWDFETFERIGKEFMKRANPRGKRRTVFFSTSAFGWKTNFLVPIMLRTQGLSIFNETMTRCVLDDERYARVLALLKKWTYEDHILPTAADEASFSAEAGYGGSEFSLFMHGHYGMIPIGRWLLIKVRQAAHRPRLAVSRVPCEDFPNTTIATRAAGVYVGSPHRAEAALFLAFLASKEYNEHIAEAVDSQTPDPRYMRAEHILRPPGHRNEWGCHEAALEAADTIAIVLRPSPFVPPQVVFRAMRRALEQVMNGSATPTEAAAEAAQRINDDIGLILRESAALERKHRRACEVQKKIDEYRRRGQPVPLEWIANPYHRRYYVFKGWSEEAKGREARSNE